MAEALALSLKLQGFEEATVAMRGLGETAKRAQDKVSAGTDSAAKSIGQFGRAMSSVAMIAASTTGVLSIFARNNEELQDKLEKATVALSLASVAMRGLGAATRFVVTPIGAIVTAIGAAIAVFLNWDRVSTAVARAAVATWRALGDFFSRLIGNLAELFGGLGKIIAGAFTFDLAKIRAGFDQVVAGAAGVATQFVEVGAAAVTAGKQLLNAIIPTKDALADLRKEMERLRAEELALAFGGELKEFEGMNAARLANAQDTAKKIAEAEEERVKELERLYASDEAQFEGIEAAKSALALLSAQERIKAEDERIEQLKRQLGDENIAWQDFARTQAQIAGEVVTEFQKIPQAFRDATNLGIQESTAAWQVYSTWFGTTMTTIQDLSRNTWSMLSSGLGDAVAQSVIFGKNLGDSMANLFKQIAATIISTIIQIATQWVISNAIMAASTAAKTTVEVTGAAVTGGAWAWAAAIKKMGLLGVVVGAVIAAVVIAGILALLGKMGSAAGGLEVVPDTGTFLLHRGERVLSRRQNVMLEEFMDGGGGGRPTVVVENHFHGEVLFDEFTYERFIRRTAREVRRRL